VDLLGRYSKRTIWASRLPEARDVTIRVQPLATRNRRLSAKRLTLVEVAALVDEYRSGATVYELASRFRVHRNTVSQYLHRQGVTMRRQGLGHDQVDHAFRLYQQGLSLARIGVRLDVNGGTVWTALSARGVRMRDTHGRDR
jgi:DNA-binding CsgD family transcriptional regulator